MSHGQKSRIDQQTKKEATNMSEKLFFERTKPFLANQSDLTAATIAAASILAFAMSSAALPDRATPGTAKHLTRELRPFSVTTSLTAE